MTIKRSLLVITILSVFISLNAQDKSAKEYKIEGADAFKAKDFTKGLESFEKAISLYEAEGKTDTSLYFNAAICAMKVDNYDKAIGYFDKAIQLNYKVCKSLLYKATSLKKLETYDQMEVVCNSGVTQCPENAKDFNDLLFQYYLVSGLEIFNNAAKLQADVTPLAKSDPEKYKSEIEKVKDEFRKSLPMLEKAQKLNPADENCNKAIKQANEILTAGSKP
jgi:tetratricopeptide (TPR) repeat protein